MFSQRRDTGPVKPLEPKPATPSATAPFEPASKPAEVTMPGLPARSPAAGQEKSDAKRLIVGKGISLSGSITACDRLIVEGTARVTLNQTRAIEITESGQFTDGKAEVEEAEISGVYEGELTVRGRLLITRTGRVKGIVRYGELELERGGRLSGTVDVLEASRPAPAGQWAASPAPSETAAFSSDPDNQ